MGRARTKREAGQVGCKPLLPASRQPAGKCGGQQFRVLLQHGLQLRRAARPASGQRARRHAHQQAPHVRVAVLDAARLHAWQGSTSSSCRSSLRSRSCLHPAHAWPQCCAREGEEEKETTERKGINACNSSTMHANIKTMQHSNWPAPAAPPPHRPQAEAAPAHPAAHAAAQG